MRMSATRAVCTRSCVASSARLFVAVWLNEPHMIVVMNAEDRHGEQDLDEREARGARSCPKGRVITSTPWA